MQQIEYLNIVNTEITKAFIALVTKNDIRLWGISEPQKKLLTTTFIYVNLTYEHEGYE